VTVEKPLRSLQSGNWFKLICGASYQSLPDVRNLTIAYALAGADCIDMAADPAVLAAAKEGLSVAQKIASRSTHLPPYQRPWLMVSMSAGEDPHFRKAWFDPRKCPADCPRPCEQVCPAAAIDENGVVRDRCYGCGRCLPICPLGLIDEQQRPTSFNAIAQQVLTQADALEIHTQVGHLTEFKTLWKSIQPWGNHLKLISVSCPDGEGLIDYLKALKDALNLSQTDTTLIWQTDGRPMSGDLGKGTTHATVRLAEKVLASELSEPVQLAGGTNQHTVFKLYEAGLLQPSNIDAMRPKAVSGIAYGSFARRLLMPTLEQTYYLEEVPQALQAAVELARSLVEPLKRSRS